jgi:hypothetical protein
MTTMQQIAQEYANAENEYLAANEMLTIANKRNQDAINERSKLCKILQKDLTEKTPTKLYYLAGRMMLLVEPYQIKVLTPEVISPIRWHGSQGKREDWSL